jgi:pyruvate,water dikinase
MRNNIVWFEEVGKNDVGLVGGKGANLGEMTRAKLPIPYGFVVTSNAYFQFIKANKLESKIKAYLENINYENAAELHQASKHIGKIIMESTIPDSLVNEILTYYDNLQAKEDAYLKKDTHLLKKALHRVKHLYNPPLVAVRSSATAEDLPTASFAGQQETFLNVKGEIHLLDYVKRCWASLFTARAIYYRHEQKFDHFKVGLAAVVQRMVQSEKSGIAFSIDPVTNDKSKIVIEAIFGLGEYIVQGKVTPDHYEVDKRSFVLLMKDVKYQNLKYVRSGVGNREVRLFKHDGLVQKLTDKEIVEVALLVKQIEEHYYFPQDIEWALENDTVFIVQSRPITTTQTGATASSTGIKQTPMLTGSPASPGIGIGPVKIIHSPNEIDKVKKGDVLVAPQTNPDYVPAMKRAIAIVTEKGGRTSHAAIVSRELGIPAVVGAEGATKKLKNDMIVSVDGKSGEVYKGSIKNETKALEGASKQQKPHRHFKTLTKIYVNLAEPEIASRVAKLDSDGIGLLRAEFMVAGIGTHPKEFIKNRQEHVYVQKLTTDLLKFVKPFSPRPIVYRATDFKTNEYRHLKGGQHYEPHEENPMIGFRGASRYIADPHEFNLELQAIKKIWDMGYTNLHLMIPFVRVPWEIIQIKELVRKSGLLDYKGFRLLIMVEVPYCALNLEEFIKVGIDGVSIGTNDLTMMLLGVDRDNQEVANVYDERNPMIIQVLEYIVSTAAKHGITSSICGQAASDYPDIVERLVKAGITSVSVNPDAVDRTRELIYHIEKKHLGSIKK